MGSFIIEKVAKMRGGRLGNFRFLATDEEISYPTPMFFIHTLSGSVPHLTREVFDIIYPPASCQPPPPIQIALDSTYSYWDVVKPSGKDISTFVGLSGCPSFLTVHDPLQERFSGFNDKNGISVWSRQGRTTISDEKFVNIVSGFNPSLFQVISDFDVGAHSSNKRFLKSITRSLKSLEECTSQIPTKSCNLFATLEAAWFTLNDEETNRALGTILEKSNYISGFVVGGLGPALKINPSKNSKNEKLDKSATEKIVLAKINIEETLPKLLSKLPQNKARYVPGPFNPVEIIDMVSMGVDIFDSSIITKMADDGLVFNFDLKKFLPNKEKDSTDISEGLAGSDISASSKQTSAVLNLKDKRYFDDFSPISPDCDCYTCRRHTKSYINHLFTVKELLGPVLMMTHNLTSFGRFFEAIRFCIQQDSENDGKEYLNKLKDSVRTSTLINTTKNDDNSKRLSDLQPESVPAITACT